MNQTTQGLALQRGLSEMKGIKAEDFQWNKRKQEVEAPLTARLSMETIREV